MRGLEENGATLGASDSRNEFNECIGESLAEFQHKDAVCATSLEFYGHVRFLFRLNGLGLFCINLYV